jgi:hypothetical protein
MSALTVDPVTPLRALDPISLDELNACASLQTRVDRKYVLPLEALAGPLAGIDDSTRVLEIDGLRSFGYESVYFDTPDLASYRMSAHRRRRRFKIRTRTYLDSRSCWLEVKTRGTRGSTVKNRVQHDVASSSDLTRGRWFVDEVLAQQSIEGTADMTFAPVLGTRYERTTLYLPGARGDRTDPGSRVTIDTGLTWLSDAQRLEMPAMVIVETKTGSTASDVDRLLWAHGHRPTRISKYATGLAALEPGLPAAPWQRTLRRHFTTTPAHATPVRTSIPDDRT